MDDSAFENTLSPASDRARRAPERAPTDPGRPDADGAPPPPETVRSDRPSRSLGKGDLPEHLKRLYVPETARFGGFIDYFAGADAKVPAFRDHGGHLATDRTDPAIVRHLVEIARHRGWITLEVRGSDEFRREVWREAAAEGLKVRGYRPTERDKIALAERSAPVDRPLKEPKTREGAPDLDKGVEGRLAEAGRAPYRREPGARETPFVRIERDGRSHEIWGVRLPEALARSGAAIGEEVRIRRTDPPLGERTSVADGGGAPAGTRRRANDWVIERAERFRSASPEEAARDPELKAAQSQLQVIETLARERLKDAHGRSRVVREAKSLIADALERGERFPVAAVEEVRRRDLSRRSVEAEARNAPERDGPERTRQR